MSVIGSSTDLIGRGPGGRKLIAVVCVDMVGYSRLIGLDDIGTLDRLRTLRRTLIDPAITEHGGKLFQTGGDSLLIVFDSIDGAVHCAVKIQRQVPDYDGDQPPDRAIRFRVGINIGDVIADDTDLHGDGVNVAVRLEAVCPVGGVCVSRAVRDHVRDLANLQFEELGALSLKNNSHPVEAFVLRPGFETVASRLPSPVPPLSVRKAKPLRLSIIAAPLRNLGVPKEHEYLVEGIPEDISRHLLQYPGKSVISFPETQLRNGASVSPRTIARELGVGYVVQGSTRGLGNRLVVNLQLIDVEFGAHLWSEQFDIDLDGVTGAHDETGRRAAWALFLKLMVECGRRIEALPPDDWTSVDLETRGWALSFRPLIEMAGPDPNRDDAMRYFEEALAKSSDSIGAKLGLVGILLRNIADDPSRSHQSRNAIRAERLLADVLRVNGDNTLAHTYMGELRLLHGRLNDCLIEFRVAIAIAPNNSWAITDLGITLALLGQPDVAIPLIEKGLRLGQRDYSTPRSYSYLGLCHLLLGNIEEAITSLRTARAINPRMSFIHWWLAPALGLKGELGEAGDALRQAFEMRPNYVAEFVARVGGYSPKFGILYRRTVYAGLRRAGLPDVWVEDQRGPN
jgi:adenylate cyclase